jgi:hypothetical protein
MPSGACQGRTWGCSLVKNEGVLSHLEERGIPRCPAALPGPHLGVLSHLEERGIPRCPVALPGPHLGVLSRQK